MGDNEKQSTYLMSLMHIGKIKRRRHGNYDDPANSRRTNTVFYTVPKGAGEIVQVCRKTFEEIFDVTHRKIQTLSEKKKAGQLVYEEKRGNKKMHRKYTEEDESKIVDHINMFPRDVSHYTRNRSSKQYLSPDLNIHRLYLAFKRMYPDINITYRFYSQVFKKRFPDLSFKPPRTDTCSTCDLLSAQIKGNPENRQILVNRLELHHRKAEKAMKIMQQDHENSQLPGSSICTCSMDLQQVLFLPTLTHSRMFYLRQLSNYNLGIHIGDTNAAYMNIWHEGISGRGGNEIASCVLKLFLNRVTAKKVLTMWSDNCCGQNKNKMILMLWIYLVIKGTFHTVDHKFLVSGHSFLSCDRDFAQIEKRKKVCKCIVPKDLVEMIANARNVQPFVVTMMQKEDFFDFKQASNLYLSTQKLNISKAQWIRISHENPGKVLIRETFNEMEEWKAVNVLKRGVTLNTLKNVSLPLLASESHISEEKKQNLREMIDYLPDPEHKRFFQELLMNTPSGT